MAIPEHSVVTALNAVVATGASDVIDVGDYTSGSLQLTGITTATVQPEVSNDGTVWVSKGAALTANGLTSLGALEEKFLRINVTSWTAGTIVGTVCIKD